MRSQYRNASPGKHCRGTNSLQRLLHNFVDTRPEIVELNLALQGGGAHGAFTWGVLDRLLEDERVEISAVSGASAGALNAIALVDGFAAGGRAGARAKLEAVWHAVMSKVQWGPFAKLPDYSAMFAFDVATRIFAPAQLNPFAVNPLREVLLSHIDFRRVRRSAGMGLYIAATDVATGEARIFGRHEMSAKAVLASACLPQLMPAVRIGGRAYWDGGFSSNPPLWPLIDRRGAEEILAVLLSPRIEPSVPATAQEIGARLSWLAFGQPLARELAAIECARTTGTLGGLFRRRLRRQWLSFIEAGSAVAGLGRATRLVPERHLVQCLKEAGRRAADAWLAQRLGERRGRRRPPRRSSERSSSVGRRAA